MQYDFKYRVLVEKLELEERIKRLSAFVNSLENSNLSFQEQGRLFRQLDAMKNYLWVLSERLLLDFQ